MKLVFFGTPEVAVPYLDRVAAEHEVLAVVTQPDRPRGRSGRPDPPPVKLAAERLGLPVLQPPRVRRPDFCACTPLAEAELLVVVAYGQVLPGTLCETPSRPAINVHYSLLPDLRGAAPVQWALLGGRQKTGVTVQCVAEELDSGDILLQEDLPVRPEDDAGSLFEALGRIGVVLLSKALGLLEAGHAQRVPQAAERATYAPALRPEEAALCWAASAVETANRIRAFSPCPGAHCHHQARRLKLYAPACADPGYGATRPGEILAVDPGGLVVSAGTGAVRIAGVQAAGARRLPAADWARGARITPGVVLQDGGAWGVVPGQGALVHE